MSKNCYMSNRPGTSDFKARCGVLMLYFLLFLLRLSGSEATRDANLRLGGSEAVRVGSLRSFGALLV